MAFTKTTTPSTPKYLWYFGTEGVVYSRLINVPNYSTSFYFAANLYIKSE